MSNDYYGCTADTIEESFIEQQCPENLYELKEALKEAKLNFNQFCELLFFGTSTIPFGKTIEESNKDEENIKKIYEKLVKHFKQMTGLELSACYTEEECACRGSEVIGGFWKVEGVYELTEAGRKWKSKITRKSWVEYG